MEKHNLQNASKNSMRLKNLEQKAITDEFNIVVKENIGYVLDSSRVFRTHL